MNLTNRVGRLAFAGAIAVGAAAGPLAAAAHAEPEGPDVPSEIAVPDGNRVFLVGHATGVQIYSCNATARGASWAFVAPMANLYDDSGQLVATHFAGPTWEARDGSTVVGRVEARVTVDPTAIPWLRLAATRTTVGADGDRLADTTYIQRTATTGGLAPAASTCNRRTVGTVAEVPYTADYHFWRADG